MLALEDHASDVLQMVDVLATTVGGDADRRQIENRVTCLGKAQAIADDYIVVAEKLGYRRCPTGGGSSRCGLTRPGRAPPPGRRSGSAASRRRVALPRRARDGERRSSRTDAPSNEGRREEPERFREGEERRREQRRSPEAGTPGGPSSSNIESRERFPLQARGYNLHRDAGDV